MKILIISMLFQPDNQIGSVRPTNFARFLVEFGHQVDVITMNPKSPMLSSNNLKIYCVLNGIYISTFFNYINKRIFAKQNKVKRVLHNIQNNKALNKSLLLGMRTQIFKLIKNYDWKSQCLKHLPKIFKQYQYDIVFSSYGPLGSYLLGRALFKKKVAKYWVSDLRDLMVDETEPSWLNRIYKYFHFQMLNEASAITIPSSDAANILCNQYSNNEFQKNKIYVINNGFEINQITNKMNQLTDDILKICYTGTLYAGRRDISLLIEAISELIQNNMIDTKKIEFHYAGGESEVLLLQTMPYHVECIIDHGFISRDDALLLQNSSDIMVVLSWNTLNEQGILTGKFFEYLATEKPIISITCGDLPNAELSNLVRTMNLGIACEYQSKANDIHLLKEYILNCYQCKVNGKSIPFNPRKEMVAKYRYDVLTRKLENLFFHLCRP